MDIAANQLLANSNSASLEHHIAVAEVFRGLDPVTIALLAGSARLRQYARGETVFSRGERPDGLLLVADGTLKLAVRGANGEAVATRDAGLLV